MVRTLPTGTITLLFTDIEGSTALLRALGERYGDVLAEHDRLLREVWARHGGTEVDHEGDAFFVAFGAAPVALEAAAAAQRVLAEHRWAGPPVRVRMGLHTGAPQVRDGRYWGEDVHYAARIAGAAHGGQVLVSAATAALAGASAGLAPLGEHALKDFPEPRPLFQLGGEEFPPPRTLVRARVALPAGGGLVGRDADVDALAERALGSERLISIVGPGGSGKTRVAVELGHRLADAFPDGVTFVALEALSDPDAGPAAVARALGLAELPGVPVLDRVVDHLRDRRALLVLDNYEHLLGAAPAAARFAAAGDGVRVVVTSQVPLRVAGEHVYPLAPLAAGDGVALLVERARAAAPTFALTEGNADAVRALVDRLEGMPLAIELAAGRLALLEPDALLARLEDSLEALGRGGRDLPARQRGLRAVLDWTTSLLEPAARATLARLSVFAGGFGLALAEDAFGDVLDDLEALLEAGLLRRAEGGRFALSPPVRRYAAGLLGDGTEAARRAHAAAVARLAGRYERVWPLNAGQASAWFNPEADNLLEALAWARDGDPGLHADILAGTTWWLNYHDLRALAREHLGVALERAGGDPRLRARLLEARGTLGLEQADPTDSLAAADAWAALSDAPREVASRFYAANLYAHRSEPEQALALAEQTLAAAEATGDPDLVWLGRLAVAIPLPDLGRGEEAIALLEPLLEQAEPATMRTFWPATALADAELRLGRYEDALRHYARAMDALEGFGSIQGVVIQAITIALALAHLGRAAEAAVVVGVCDVAARELSTVASPLVRQILGETRALLTAEQLAEGRARAEAMGLDAGLEWTAAVAAAG